MSTFRKPPSKNSLTNTSFVGQDPKVLSILRIVEKVADSYATVLIVGESGTGKEIIARMLHERSARRNHPFIAVNCGAIAETLQESELFGHVKGAFTDAHSRKPGKFEVADGGSIFLDEVEEMSKDLQVKLLRVLQTGEYAPVGMPENLYTDVRIIAATNQDLQAKVGQGTFREDFYYRLNIIRLELPPLRERKPDIPLLTDHFLAHFNALYDKSLELSADTRDRLAHYSFPGNVRELENMIHRMVVLSSDTMVTPTLLPVEVTRQVAEHFESPDDFHLAKANAIETFEKKFLTFMLNRSGGIISRAATLSGLSERNFHEKMKKYGIHGKLFRLSS